MLDSNCYNWMCLMCLLCLQLCYLGCLCCCLVMLCLSFGYCLLVGKIYPKARINLYLRLLNYCFDSKNHTYRVFNSLLTKKKPSLYNCKPLIIQKAAITVICSLYKAKLQTLISKSNKLNCKPFPQNDSQCQQTTYPSQYLLSKNILGQKMSIFC